jgi:curved DNA-binding protein CbpA
MIESAYEMLRIPRDAAPEEVRAAYVRVVRRYPPERFPERFAAFSNAYQKLCLDDDFLEDLLETGTSNATPLEFAGFLWGDRKELRPEESDLLDLALLADNERARNADVILESVDTSNIKWRGKN